MKILIVEDDPFKMIAIRKLVEGANSRAAISGAESLRSAMTALEDSQFDFVILDMAIPSHAGDAGPIDTYSQPVGGLDVLMFLSSNARRDQVLILTQYPTVEYNRVHVPLKILLDVFKADDVENAVAAIHFEEDPHWDKKLLAALGIYL